MTKHRIKLYVVPHSHIDMEWFWTVQDVEHMLPELFYNSILRVMSGDPEMTFAQDQSLLIQMMLENASEEEKAHVAACVAADRIEPVGGMYVQPELQEPCGEALIRQIQIGQKWMQENLGRRALCAWHIDSFGQINQMPQILLQSGFESYVFMRDLHEKEDPAAFPTEFYYEGPDGSRILTHWLKNSYVLCPSGKEDRLLKIANVEVNAQNEQAELKKVFAAFLDETSLQHKTGAALILWGDDLYEHNLSTTEIKQLLIEAASRAGFSLPEEDIVFSTPSRFFQAIRPRSDELPVKQNDFNLPQYRQDLRATFVTRIKLKQLNRKAEQALLSLDSLSAAAGQTVENSDMLWKPVLFNQFHDTIAGSCVDEVYLAAVEKYENVLQMVQNQKQTLFENTSATDSFCVYNPTQFVRSDVVGLPMAQTEANIWVEDETGNRLPAHYNEKTGHLEVLIADIAPYAVERFRLVTGKKSKSKDDLAQSVENSFYRLQIDLQTGDLVSVWDKLQKRELLDAPANVLVALKEENPEMEGALCLTGEEFSDAGLTADRVEICSDDTGVSVLCVKRFLGFTVQKRIVLRKNSRRLDFTTNIIGYTGEDYLLLAQFPVKMYMTQSVFETPFGIAEGRTEFHCAQKWAALRDDAYYAALLNRGTSGYWVRGNKLSIALLRGHQNYVQYGINGRDKGIARFFDGKTHTELAAERGDHSFEYALVCGVYTKAQITGDALMYNSPLEAFWGQQAAAFVPVVKSVSDDFIVTRAALSHDGTLCLRGYYLGTEVGKCSITLYHEIARVWRTNLLGEVTGYVPADTGKVEFTVRPFEIATLVIEKK